MRRRSHGLAGAILGAGLACAAAGCTGDAGTDAARARPVSAATEAWWAYARPATYDVVTEEVDVPMRDGVTLGCVLGRPASAGVAAEGRFPGLVVEFTPYVVLRDLYRAEADFFVSRGYATLVCTLRGTGRSGGTWQHAMSSQDGRDAHDLVEWLATQPFSDGRVGQFGESYGGATSYGAAVERAPHLRAIAPLQPPHDLYRDVVYPGGIKSTERGALDDWPPGAELLSAGAIDAAAEYAVNRAHPTFDAYWQDHSLIGRYDAIEVPVLTVGGWSDGYFRAGTLAAAEARPERTWVVYGPWPHTLVVALCECETSLLPGGVLLAWFDHWVMELPDVPVPSEPTFVSFEGPDGTGDGWREVVGWDPHGESGLRLELGADGSLSERAGREGTVAFREPAAPGASAAATFTTESLADDQVLLGHPTLSLRATLDAADAHFHVALIDVHPDGSETLVNDGFLAARHRSSHTDPQPVVPGETVDYRVAIRPQHHRFAAGHRVRVRIGGGDPDMLVPPATPVEVTIHAGAASSIRLPGFTALR